MKLLPDPGPQRTALQAVGVILVMGSLSWASVPFYDWFCRVTGFGGATNVTTADAYEATDIEIDVRFDASLERDMPWDFTPVERKMTVNLGEPSMAFYEASNPLDVPVMGTASYNVTPYEAGAFFDKIDCFCFEEQLLEPGETVMMPVSFVVDPAIVDDREGQFVHTITLSYTFHRVDLPPDSRQAALQLD
ncbi:MAG: cytochrome c oxidase assembly protein [Paracoccaceae bacterium]